MAKKKTREDEIAEALMAEWATTDMRGATELLGYKSINTTRALIASGELPAFKVSNKPGAAVRIRISDVIALFQPVVPKQALEQARSRQPGPLHPPIQGGGK